jgi:hypothetical protein
MSDQVKMTSLSFKKDYIKPDEEKDRQLGFIKWGKKNNYPFFLVDLLNGSAWHAGIIKNKTYYIAGGGVEIVSGNMQPFIDNKYSEFDMNEIAELLAYDYEIFGGFCVIGTWNRDGSRVAVWEHLDLDLVRVDASERMYYISDDWTAMQQSAEKTNLRSIPALDMNNKTGKFIIYYKDPVKRTKTEQGIYPKPPYYGGITAIQTDVDISRFHMHEIANSFKGGTMISFCDGYPETQEEAENIKAQVKGRTQSVEDAGEIIITFSDSKDKAPIVQSLNGNDLDKRYETTEQSVQQNILVSHSVVAPSLFGVAPEGSFNAAETADLFEVFKKTYVDARQRRLEWMLNQMAELGGYIGQVKLKDVSPLVSSEAPAQAPAQAVAPVMTQESAFNRQDVNALMDIVTKLNDGKITHDSALSIVLASFPTIDEAQARRIVGMPATGSQQFSSCKHIHTFSDDEIKLFEEFGTDADEFKVLATYPIAWDTPSEQVFTKHDQIFATIGEIKLGLKDIDKNVLSLIQRGEDGVSISKALEISVEEVAKSLQRLSVLELVSKMEITELGSTLIEEVDVPAERFEIAYTYREVPGIPPVKSESRDFCLRLIDANRKYTREELNTISSRVDRDVWKYRGGWYTNPDTQKSTPWCRHEWVQQIVIRQR